MMKTVECDHCGASFERYPSQIAKSRRHYCDPECRAKGMRKDEVATRYRMVNVGTSHPLAGVSGVIPEHRLLVFDAIGQGPHPCRWCGGEVDWLPGQHTGDGALVVDHINGDPKDNRIENLAASCHTCNSARRHDRVKDDEVWVTVKSTGNRTRALLRNCRTCGGEFKVTPSQVRSKKNGGTYCSRECMYRRPR